MSAFTFSNGPQMGQVPTTKSITELCEAYNTLSSALHAHMQNKVDSTDVQDNDGIAALTSEQSSGYTHNIQPVLNKIVRCLQNDISRITQLVAQKASNSDMSDVSTALSVLQNTVATIQDSIGGKVNSATYNQKISQLESSIAAKAGTADLNGAIDRIDALEDSVATKASAADVENLETTVSAKAGTADLNGAIDRIDALETDAASLAHRADLSEADIEALLNFIKITESEDVEDSHGNVLRSGVKVLELGCREDDNYAYVRFLNRPVIFEKVIVNNEPMWEKRTLVTDKDVEAMVAIPLGTVMEYCKYEAVPDATDTDGVFERALIADATTAQYWLPADGADIRVEDYPEMVGILPYADLGHTKLKLPKADRSIIKVRSVASMNVNPRFPVDYNLANAFERIIQLEGESADSQTADNMHETIIEQHTAQLANESPSGLKTALEGYTDTAVATEAAARKAADTELTRFLQNKKVYESVGDLPDASPDGDGNTWQNGDTAVVFDGTTIKVYEATATVTVDGTEVTWSEVNA